jgi:hypothetical protein
MATSRRDAPWGNNKLIDQINTVQIMKHKRKTLTFLMLLVGVTTTVFAQQGFGINQPNASAAVDITSTTQGFLPPRMTSAQIAAIANPAEGLVVYNTTLHCLSCYISGAFACTFVNTWKCGDPMVVAHTAGIVAPVTKTVTYTTLVSTITGSTKCWILQNLGADHPPTAADDATEASSGWYWQYNRAQGYKMDGATMTPATMLATIDETSDWVAANDPCTLLLGAGWRIPTYDEWMTYRTNILAIPVKPFPSQLKIHRAGVAYTNTVLSNTGYVGWYWGSGGSMGSSGPYGWTFNYMTLNDNSQVTSTQKKYANSLRCLKD